MILDSALLYFKDPEHTDRFWTRALVLVNLGRYQEALNDLKKFFELSPEKIIHSKMAIIIINLLFLHRQ